MLAVPDGHPLVEADAIHWTDLRSEVFVLPTDGIGPVIANVLTSKLGAHGYRANIILQDTSIESVISTVTIGRYITLTTEASNGVVWPGLKFLEIADSGGAARRDFVLYWGRDNEKPALNQFIQNPPQRSPILQDRQHVKCGKH